MPRLGPAPPSPRLPLVPWRRYVLPLLATTIAFGVLAAAQDDAVVLTALRSRDAIVRAMNTAASEMGAQGDTGRPDGSWRSGIIQRTEPVRVNGRSGNARCTAVVTSTMRGEPPDSVRVTFRTQVAADVMLSSSDRSTVARRVLSEFATLTNRALGRDPVH
jgi:hypothetical protein